LALVLAAGLNGCGALGRDAAPVGWAAAPAIPPGTGGVTPPSADPSGPLPIPSPAQVFAQLHGAKQVSSLLTRDADDFVAGLSHRVTTMEPDVILSPNWENGYSPFETIAWAIYRFDLTARTGRLEIHTQWPQPPGDYTRLWLGASDWQKNRWQWYNGAPKGIVQTAVGSIDTFKHPGTGEMYVAVVLLGQSSALLRKVWLTCSLRGDWWMFGRNPLHQSCSPFKGPDYPTVKWQTQLGIGYCFASAVYDAEGTLYIAAENVGDWKRTLYALDPDGSKEWECPLPGVISPIPCSPAIDDDGTVYYAQGGGGLLALRRDGTQKWTFAGEDGGVWPDPALGPDGTVYVCSGEGSVLHGRYLNALNRVGGAIVGV
jgi:hypothetical protein